MNGIMMLLHRKGLKKFFKYKRRIFVYIPLVLFEEEEKL
jgi:hypothetical protein